MTRSFPALPALALAALLAPAHAAAPSLDRPSAPDGERARNHRHGDRADARRRPGPHVPGRRRRLPLSGTAYALLNGPLIGFFLVPFLMNLLLGRGRRQREAAADRFAVEVIGDQELVIATLTKLHTLNASPHQLRPSDEILSSHPSLVHRIEAIRSAQSRGTAKTRSQE